MKNLVIVISLVMFFATAGGVKANEYEVPSDHKITEILPAEKIKGPHYLIRERVPSFGYMHHFTVDSDFGVFEITGDGALRKLLKEIQAIAALKKIKESKAYLESVKNAGKMPYEFGKNMITHPVDTVTGVPKGVYSLFSNIGTSVSHPHDPSEDSRIKTVLAVSANKRDYAHELGVDVYSSNPVLQKELNSVAWAGAAGSLSVSVALMPFGGAGVLTVKYSRLSQQFNNLQKEEPPARIRQMIGEKLSAMGVSKDLAERFLDHLAFTPRHDTIIVESLTIMKGARGQDAFINLALTAEDEESANFFQAMAETMRGYHETVSPIKKITVSGGLVFARAANGSVLMPFPLDHGVWSTRAESVVSNALTDNRKAYGSGQNETFNLWVTGTLTPLAKTQMGKLGINVTENVDTRIEFMD